MPKFRKKPVVIEAEQFTDTNKEQTLNWAKQFQMNICHAWDENNNPVIRIPTLEGEMTASLGDWIIRGVAGEMYPCKPDIFEATYEAVNDKPIPPEQTEDAARDEVIRLAAVTMAITIESKRPAMQTKIYIAIWDAAKEHFTKEKQNER